MLKRLNLKLLLKISYVLIFGIFLVAVYFFTIYCCANFFNKDRSPAPFSWDEEASSPDNTDSNGLNSSNQSGLASQDQAINSELIFYSFFDSFASSHLIDATTTTLFRDDLAAAVYFPPDYSWQAAPAEIVDKYKNEFEGIYLNDFSKPLAAIDRRCLGRDCLEQKGKKLSYNGKSVVLPKNIKENDIMSVSIGSLRKRWLIGVTLRDGVNYQGRVFYFDGKKITPLLFPDNQEKISSPYIGVFGFGGEESDFLLIYGSYRGIAYRIQEEKTVDISRFFDFRVMAMGFRPEVIKAASGKTIYWYVFSSSLNHPQLIKLWQNQDGEISGEAIYQSIFSDSIDAASFRLLETEATSFNLLARLKQGTSETWQVFSDLGFNNYKPGEMVFNPIPVESEIIIQKIADSQLGSAEAPCLDGKFSFSTDNSNWQELSRGENLNKNFRTPVKDNFFLRVDFPEQADKFYSPFLAEVLFDFYYQK